MKIALADEGVMHGARGLEVMSALQLKEKVGSRNAIKIIGVRYRKDAKDRWIEPKPLDLRSAMAGPTNADIRHALAEKRKKRPRSKRRAVAR